MNTKINVMGVEISIIEYKQLEDLVKEYLTDDYMNTIFLLSTEMLKKADEDEEYRELLKEVDLLLPGEEAILSTHHGELLKTGGMVVDYTSFIRMLDEMGGQPITMYLLGNSKEEVELITQFCAKKYPLLQIIDTSYLELEANTDVIINSVNGIAPDILLSTIDSSTQAKWFASNYVKLNAKLCINLGDVIETIINDFKGTPKLIHLLHLQGIYNLFISKFQTNNSYRSRIFRKKIAQYKNKKGDSGHGDKK